MSGAQHSESLLVILTVGLEDGGRRAAIAFGVALAALTEGKTAYVFLTLEAAALGTPTGSRDVRPRGFSDPLDTYVEHFLELGGKLEVCSSCYLEYCKDYPKGPDGHPLLRHDTKVTSLSSVASRSSAMPVVTF